MIASRISFLTCHTRRSRTCSTRSRVFSLSSRSLLRVTFHGVGKCQVPQPSSQARSRNLQIRHREHTDAWGGQLSGWTDRRSPPSPPVPCPAFAKRPGRPALQNLTAPEMRSFAVFGTTFCSPVRSGARSWGKSVKPPRFSYENCTAICSSLRSEKHSCGMSFICSRICFIS